MIRNITITVHFVLGLEATLSDQMIRLTTIEENIQGHIYSLRKQSSLFTGTKFQNYFGGLLITLKNEDP